MELLMNAETRINLEKPDVMCLWESDLAMCEYVYFMKQALEGNEDSW